MQQTEYLKVNFPIRNKKQDADFVLSVSNGWSRSDNLDLDSNTRPMAWACSKTPSILRTDPSPQLLIVTPEDHLTRYCGDPGQDTWYYKDHPTPWWWLCIKFERNISSFEILEKKVPFLNIRTKGVSWSVVLWVNVFWTLIASTMSLSCCSLNLHSVQPFSWTRIVQGGGNHECRQCW